MLERYSFQDDGLIATSPADRWRLGCVAFIESEGHFALVRKSCDASPDYDLAGLWAMPGGMIREASNIRRTMPEAVTVSLKSRIAAEAGLKPTETFHVPPIGPIVSRYTRGRRTRSTLIVVRRLALQADVPLTVHDPSISEARWQSVPPKWIELAPANRLALAHLLWPRMTEKERAAGYREIEEASERCSQWASAVGVIAAPVPWAERKRLDSWMRGFP